LNRTWKQFDILKNLSEIKRVIYILTTIHRIPLQEPDNLKLASALVSRVTWMLQARENRLLYLKNGISCAIFRKKQKHNTTLIDKLKRATHHTIWEKNGEMEKFQDKPTNILHYWSVAL